MRFYAKGSSRHGGWIRSMLAAAGLSVACVTVQLAPAFAQSADVSTIRLAREGVTKAQDNLTASIARYRAGEAQIVEVTDAQTTLVTQRSALYQAIFDYQVALSRLKQATGQ